MWLLRTKRRWSQRAVSSLLMNQWLKAALPLKNESWKQVPLLAIDLETTSLDANTGEIVSIGWVEIDGGRISLGSAKHYHLAVKNGVGQSAVFHQISDSRLTSAQPIEQVMDRLLNASHGRVLVFHNAHLDMSFLNKISRTLYNTTFLAPYIDTLLLEKRLMQRKGRPVQHEALRLYSCRRRYNLPEYPAHDALTDALATAELLLAWVASSSHGRARLSDLIAHS